MDDSTAPLLLIFVLLTFQALVNLMNASLQNVQRGVIRERAEAGDQSAKYILTITENALRLAITVSMIRVLMRFSIASLLVLVALAQVNTTNSTTLILMGLLSVFIGASITLIFGDLVPEAIGTSKADTLAGLSINPMRGLIFIFSPLTITILFISKFISSIFGSGQQVNLVTEEEIMTLVNAGHSGGTIEDEEKDMIYSVLQLGESTARELMTPRIDIIALDVKNTVMDALTIFVESGFSRVPIYEESVDNVIGLLYAKDILTLMRNNDSLENQPIRDLIRSSYFVPETKRADELLKELQARNVHLAIVVDEYGGTSGLVTIENLIEEIIGDIRDEYDTDEEEEYILEQDGTYMISASMDLDDVNELLDCSIDTTDADTLGGFIFLTLGRVPMLDEAIDTQYLHMTVKSIDGHRIRKVEVVRKTETEHDDETTIENDSDESQKLKDEVS